MWHISTKKKKKKKKTFLPEEHNWCCIGPSAGNSEIFIGKRTTQIIVCSPFSTQRPTLPIRHKNSQNTALSLYCPSCRQRALRWQVGDKKTMARQGSPGQRGEREENGPSEGINGGSVQREQIYILINKNNYLHDFGGGFCTKRIQKGQKRLWVQGYYPMQMVEMLRWHCEIRLKTGEGITPSVGPHKHWEEVFVCFFSLRDERKDAGRTKFGRWVKKKNDNAFLYLCLPAWLLCMTVFSASP